MTNLPAGDAAVPEPSYHEQPSVRIRRPRPGVQVSILP